MHQGWTAASGDLTRADTGLTRHAGSGSWSPGASTPSHPHALTAELGRPAGIYSSFFLLWTHKREPSISLQKEETLPGQWAPAQRKPDFYLVFKWRRSVLQTGIFSLFLLTLVMLNPHSVQKRAPVSAQHSLARITGVSSGPWALGRLWPVHQAQPTPLGSRTAPRACAWTPSPSCCTQASEGKPTAARHLSGEKPSHGTRQRRKPSEA